MLTPFLAKGTVENGNILGKFLKTSLHWTVCWPKRGSNVIWLEFCGKIWNPLIILHKVGPIWHDFHILIFQKCIFLPSIFENFGRGAPPIFDNFVLLMGASCSATQNAVPILDGGSMHFQLKCKNWSAYCASRADCDHLSQQTDLPTSHYFVFRDADSESKLNKINISKKMPARVIWSM